ncbi:MAG: hypothetical protein V8Q79_05830 [Christensenellales bacterium]
MEDPDVLILDEPFNAMDKASMEEVHDLLQRFKAQGKTVLLASHSAEDIARACDVIYEMEDGEPASCEAVKTRTSSSILSYDISGLGVLCAELIEDGSYEMLCVLIKTEALY